MIGMTVIGLSAVKPLRRPRWWLRLWWLAIVVVIVVSLVPPPPLPGSPPGSDKLAHFLAYFALAASAVQLFATRATLLRVGIGLVLLGIALEVAQYLLTSTRMMDPADALANTLGVLAGMAIARTPLRDLLLRFDQ